MLCVISLSKLSPIDQLLLHSLAYRSGVTTGITAPTGASFLSGYSTVFSTGSAHKLEHGAVVQDVAALHVKVSMSYGASVSTQIAALRALLLKGPAFEEVRNVRIRFSYLALLLLTHRHRVLFLLSFMLTARISWLP